MKANDMNPTDTKKKQAQLKKKVVVNLPKELSQLVVDTKRYKEKASSTEILQQLRYHAT